MKDYRWAAIGCGDIARQFAQAMRQEGRTLYGVANRTYEKAAAFAEEYSIPRVYERISDVFTDENVDIVYIATPHNTHSGYINEALRHGKHVLCEKAITLDIGELKEAQVLAEERGLVLAEAMTIYHMPLYKRLREIAESGALGKLCMIQMNFGSFKEYDMTNRFFKPRSGRRGALGHRRIRPFLHPLVHVPLSVPACVAGKIRAKRRG